MTWTCRVNARSLARGFASSARTLAEPAITGSSPTPSSRPRSNHQSQRSTQSNGGTASDRIRAGQRDRSLSQQGGHTGNSNKNNNSRSSNRSSNNNNNRNAGGDRRHKRLPSVFDAASATAQARASRPANQKSLMHASPKKMPAPLPKTDWNSPLFSRPGFERLLASAPRPSSVFVPNLAAAASSAPASAPAAGGKGKGKGAAAPVKGANTKLNLPGIKSANNALKLHILPGGRMVLGPLNEPTGVAAGMLSQSRVALERSSDVKATDDKSLAEELKAARIALQNEQIGGSYERFEPHAILKSIGIQPNAPLVSADSNPLVAAVQALALNADLAPQAKRFVAKTIADRISC
ncbi:uncharacterized protein UMAG_06143 [Mycosarcoma maydis]|uniref:Uncharacterized protein n=1 Tax=Mycosarcoma maydis TaxID=5270 RepID=A0A0D1CGF4_MYCMD|nr:uncharacterized protein UMAG_06143 [Ustilago maydis 521]KIS66053.1 hypothetical protein UMAG_06143 [Ustilago maydis 521]|eukprot:XP_011392483.1 hypothetical protein UMAG_06143 [Ustilago maydis 521]